MRHIFFASMSSFNEFVVRLLRNVVIAISALQAMDVKSSNVDGCVCHVASLFNCVRHPPLFDVMLLEISHGQHVENLRQPEALGPSQEAEELSDLSAVRRWPLEQKIKGDISLAFYATISYCLKCFVGLKANLDESDFSRSIEESRLAPLQDERNALLGPA
ncbi:hypothetical protein BT63DRAFT_452161 [Microthyrium microscopicum]|uniref:Uncharacterized protein n=1 Tax=Microthyrium microscopicum TaxID=703497 RepID=A0A6A6UJL5_9PEZI|nr:hypothetical protein BT63DRAFT_452161 [Microthyrium microscopicum]